MSEPLTLDENLFMLRGVIGDLRRGFSRAVDTGRWVSDTQAFIDHIREQAQRANVSAATRGDSVVAEGVTAGETALQPAWQPIATAPKDGTWFLAWDYDGGSYVYRMGPGFFTGEDPQPTHWMPLPDPPRAGTVDELSRASATPSASEAQK